jgi:hypothetical protein
MYPIQLDVRFFFTYPGRAAAEVAGGAAELAARWGVGRAGNGCSLECQGK